MLAHRALIRFVASLPHIKGLTYVGPGRTRSRLRQRSLRLRQVAGRFASRVVATIARWRRSLCAHAAQPDITRPGIRPGGWAAYLDLTWPKEAKRAEPVD